MHDRLGEWRRLIDRCERKPTRKRVHALRVVTLRLQAELEIDLAELPRASHQAQAILDFSKQGEKLRKALGPVREIDVWIGKLQGLRASLAESGGYVPRSTRECVRQIGQFEARLRQDRRRLEKKLIVVVEKRGEDFAAAAEVVGAEIADRPMNDGVNAAGMIRARFAEIAEDFPAFDAENLHEFRKRIKLIRYLAEIHEGDPACAQIAAQMKKLQSAIGEWHDWQALVREIQRGGWKGKDALELLDAIAAESLEAALATSRIVTHKVIAGGATAPDAAPVRKAPQRADHDLSTEADRKLA